MPSKEEGTAASGRESTCALAALALLLAILQPAAAINIVIQLDDDGQNPNYDLAGARLEAVFRAAEAIWERLLPDSGTYEIDVWWGDLDDGVGGEWQHTGTLADNNIVIDPTPRMADGTNLGWFIDDTPSDHSEFDFLTKIPNTGQGGNAAGMTVYRDLDANQQGAWFDSPRRPVCWRWATSVRPSVCCRPQATSRLSCNPVGRLTCCRSSCTRSATSWGSTLWTSKTAGRSIPSTSTGSRT